MRVLFISNLYPNPLFLNMASYNRQQIAALSEYCEIDVISPIPWPAVMKGRYGSSCRKEGNVTVYHPTYLYTPRMLRGMYGRFFLHSISTVARRLLRQNSYDLIYSSWLYPDSWAAAQLAAEFNLPLFVKVHGSDVNLLQLGKSVTRQSLEVVNRSKKVICVSRALKERLIELGAPEAKLEVLYNGVDRTIFHPMDRQALRRELNILQDEFVVLFVGNLKKDKGLGELISAYSLFLAQHPGQNSHLVLIGTGHYESNSRRLLGEMGIEDKVLFLGSRVLTDIARWMNAANVLCLPSYMEGVPNVVLESIACGTPVIATNVGGIPELLDGNNIILVPPKTIEPLAAALSEVMQMDELRRNGGKSMSWEQNAECLKSFFLVET